MAALGLTQGQLGIGVTIYPGVVDLTLPAVTSNRIVHLVANSTRFPMKEAGYQPSSLAGVLHKLTPAQLIAFTSDARMGTAERKVSYLLGGTECYVYAMAADLGAPVPFYLIGSPVAADQLYTVSFTFPMSRSCIYAAADDSILFGG